MAALDNPFYFTVADEDRIELLGGERSGAKYYNVKGGQGLRAAPRGPPSPLHHTLSTFQAHTPVRQWREKLCQISRYGTSFTGSDINPRMKSADMLDIAIFSCRQSEAAALWVKYLTSCFQQICKEEKRPPFKLESVNVEDVLGGVWMCGGECSRLQIVIVCPMMLQALGSSPGAGLLVSSLQPATVLAMLLGVTPQALDSHHLSGVFRFEQWRKLVVKDQDPTFVGDFMGVSMDILSRSWQLEQAIHQMNIDNNKAHFSIVPKKIKVGQNKLIVLLTTPLSTNDKINVSVDKNGQKIEVPNVKRRNPYTLQFSMPVACLQTSMLVAVNVERNGRSLGQRLVKCESRLRELDQLLKSVDNPLHFMCQALGFSLGDKEHLDNFLVAALQKNMPPNFHLLNSMHNPPASTNEEFPTLLHFGARFGLEKLCWQLLDCPGGEQACQMKNAGHQTPADLAEKSGHVRLAHALKGYLQMTELSSMYHYIKGISEKPQGLDEANYLLPRPLSDTYLVPPSARPVLPQPTSPLSVHPPSPPTPSTPVGPRPPTPRSPIAPLPSPLDNYQSPPTARPFTPATPTTPSSPQHDFASYLQMHSPHPEPLQLRLDLDFVQGRYKNVDAQSQHSDQCSVTNGNHTTSLSSNSSMSGKMSPQDELVEIINDFKNNVFTISEVEKLVEAWRNRNDVQQSFREKQEQLNQMRLEYDRIQQAMKEQMKRATPFERIKKFFSRKSKHVESTPGKGKPDAVSHRPVSSLSLHSSCSSSSSGQMSTGSGTSLGDSGTHSDHDEKKSEDFIFHDKLQSVKESEHSGSSFPGEYVPAGNNAYGEDIFPQPPGIRGKTVAIVHQVDEIPEEPVVNHLPMEETNNRLSEILVSNTQLEEPSSDKLSEEEKESDKTDIENEEAEEEHEEQQKTEDGKLLCAEETKEMIILEQSERLLKDMADTLTRKTSPEGSQSEEEISATEDDPLLKTLEVLEDLSSSEVPDYVNVSPFPAPPVPPRCKYKNVIL